jgi:hypothetical protein
MKKIYQEYWAFVIIAFFVFLAGEAFGQGNWAIFLILMWIAFIIQRQKK